MQDDSCCSDRNADKRSPISAGALETSKCQSTQQMALQVPNILNLVNNLCADVLI